MFNIFFIYYIANIIPNSEMNLNYLIVFATNNEKR